MIFVPSLPLDQKMLLKNVFNASQRFYFSEFHFNRIFYTLGTTKTFFFYFLNPMDPTDTILIKLY